MSDLSASPRSVAASAAAVPGVAVPDRAETAETQALSEAVNALAVFGPLRYRLGNPDLSLVGLNPRFVLARNACLDWRREAETQGSSMRLTPSEGGHALDIDCCGSHGSSVGRVAPDEGSSGYADAAGTAHPTVPRHANTFETIDITPATRIGNWPLGLMDVLGRAVPLRLRGSKVPQGGSGVSRFVEAAPSREQTVDPELIGPFLEALADQALHLSVVLTGPGYSGRIDETLYDFRRNGGLVTLAGERAGLILDLDAGLGAAIVGDESFGAGSREFHLTSPDGTTRLSLRPHDPASRDGVWRALVEAVQDCGPFP